MTPTQIIQAYVGVHQLTPIVLPYKRARELAALKKALEKEMSVIDENEQALAESLNGKRQGGDYIFTKPEIAEQFQASVKAMHEENDDAISLPTVDLSDQTSQLKISADAIAALEGIVIFERHVSPAHARQTDVTPKDKEAEPDGGQDDR